MCNHSGVARKDLSITWNAIVVPQVMKYTLSPLHFEMGNRPKYNFFSYQSTSMLCKTCIASHHLKQVRCLALAVIVFSVVLVFSMRVTSVLDLYSLHLRRM